MNRRLTSAFIIALLISGVFTLWLSTRFSKNRGGAASVPTKSQYVAAAVGLQADQIIRAEDLRMIDWPASVPLPGAYSSPGALIGRTVLYPLPEGDPILERQLSAAGTGSGLTARIPNGMRAISLRTDDVVGVAGFLLPGTHVDVLVTLHTGTAPDPVTFTALQDVVVLASGQKTQPDPEGRASSAMEVTILVNPEDAERVVLASNQGTIHFALRNGIDSEQYKGPPALLAQLSGIPQPAPQKIKEAPKAPQQLVAKIYSVETILGKTQRMDDFQ